jgi:rhomboid protease GluP
MSTTADMEFMQSVAPRWQVRFLFDQAGPAGRRPKSQWKWIGKGGLSVDGEFLALVGKRHRTLWPGAKQAVRVGLQQVRNVEASGRQLQFEVVLEGDRTELVRLRASDAQTAQEIAAALPTTRTAEVDRAIEEKRAFDKAIEQLGSQPIATYGLVAANVLVFVLIATQGGGWFIPDPRVLVHWGSNFGPATLNGEWWRLFTSMFLHFGLMHLAVNMWVLWRMGCLTERMFGSLHYLFLYVFAGLCGSLASLWWHPYVNSAGASGAIFGVLGGLLAFVVNPATGVPATVVARHRSTALVFIAYSLLNGFTHRGIDNACHMGGLAGGFVMGWLLARPLSPAAREEESRWALSAALGLAALTTVGWFLAHRPHPPAVDVAFQDNLNRNPIAFYPGRYRTVVMNSGEAVSAAMHAVYAADDPTALDAAIATMQKMVDAGDAEAAFRLGRYYHLESAEPDYTLALKYYQLAADANHAWATNNLGLLYKDGLGVARNANQAHEYFQKAAHQDNPWAYVNLADMAFGERGAPDAAAKGIALLEEGARNTCTLCLIEEASIYHSGAHGIRADSEKAVWLLHKAAALGDNQAELILAELYIVGDGVPQSSSTSFRLLKTLSDNGNAAATNLLGELSSDDKLRNYLFSTSLGGAQQIPADFTRAFPQDPSTAIRYWERAGQQGSCESWINLSSVYDRGIGVSTDYRAGADYVERGARCNPTNSFYTWKRAMRFYDARGREHDCQAAKRLLTQSLDRGYADAGVNLGYIYDKGCSPIARDDHHALQVYLLCAKLGVALCQNNVGAMIKHGRGVPTADPARGYGWIKLAALRGDDLAKANLGDPLFTTSVRAAGLANLADIQRRLLAVPADPQDIQRDPWY